MKNNFRTETGLPPGGRTDLSIHRAFVYSASLPGLGDWYAGNRRRAVIFFAALASLMATAGWYSLRSFHVIQTYVDVSVFPSHSSSVFRGLVFSLAAIYGLWLCSMFSAIESAASGRAENALPPQRNLLWGVAMAWLCPGAGQAYTGRTRYGLWILTASAIAALFMILSYLNMTANFFKQVLSGGYGSDPLRFLGALREMEALASFGAAGLLRKGAVLLAIAETVLDLKPASNPEIASSGWRAVIPAGLGLLCPGAGQLYQGRNRAGWGVFGGSMGGYILLGLLLRTGLISYESAITATWLPAMLGWAAAVEAPVREVMAAERKAV